MAATYEPIATQTLSSPATGIDFTSIPATYTDLRIVMLPLVVSTWDNSPLRMRFNSDSTTNYSRTRIRGNGSTVSSERTTSADRFDVSIGGIMVSTPTLYEIDVFSYAGSTYKTCLMGISDDLNGSGYSGKGVGLWRSTSAITSISLYSYVTDILAAGTTATLYGILKA
jgi:hypothetical protein